MNNILLASDGALFRKKLKPATILWILYSIKSSFLWEFHLMHFLWSSRQLEDEMSRSNENRVAMFKSWASRLTKPALDHLMCIFMCEIDIWKIIILSLALPRIGNSTRALSFVISASLHQNSFAIFSAPLSMRHVKKYKCDAHKKAFPHSLLRLEKH